MSVFGDIWDAVTGVVGDVGDVAGDIFDEIPGNQHLKDLVNGPLRDFAKSPVGMVVLRAIATAMYMPLANELLYWGVPFGAQMATVAWTTPGLLRGEDFDEAWMIEFRYRAEKTAEYFGGSKAVLDMFGKQLQDALDQLASQFEVGDLIKFTAEQLAEHLDIRVDVAEFAIALWNRIQPPAYDEFDPKTGRRYTPIERAINRGAIIETFDDARANRTSAIAKLFPSSSSSSTSTTRSPAPATRAPAIASSGATSSPTTSTRSKKNDVVLAVAIVAAAGALVWWHREESRR